MEKLVDKISFEKHFLETKTAAAEYIVADLPSALKRKAALIAENGVALIFMRHFHRGIRKRWST